MTEYGFQFESFGPYQKSSLINIPLIQQKILHSKIKNHSETLPPSRYELTSLCYGPLHVTQNSFRKRILNLSKPICTQLKDFARKTIISNHRRQDIHNGKFSVTYDVNSISVQETVRGLLVTRQSRVTRL